MNKKFILILLSCVISSFGIIGAAQAAPSAELYINSDTVDEFTSTSKIEGCAVTYDFIGECDLYTAFYKNGILSGVDKTAINTTEGNNYFTAEIENAKNYSDCEIKYFLWNEMIPLDTEADFYRLNDFSDNYEPYYPMLTASQKTTEEIYNSTLPTSFELTQAQATARYNVIEMYKNAGFDIVRSMSDSTYNKFSIPSSWSRLTPKSLTGEYEHTYSIDACFNRKIPENAPKVELNDEVLDLSDFQMAVVNSKKNPGGQGTGIARVIGTESDPVMSVASRWDASVYYVQTLYNMHLPEDTADRLNYNMSSDRHAVFIDDTLKTAVHMYKITPPSSAFEYDITDGRLPGYDIRGRASGAMSDLTGIGAEGLSGAYASKVPADGMTIKSNEISNPDTMINHAISAAINPVMYGVICPAITSDCGTVDNASNFGAVPEGGLIQLDKDIDLEELYNNGKLSLPGYKILKAMQEYGMYNVDRTGSAKGYGVMMYTSTNSSDWINENDTTFNVPYKNNAQGFDCVNTELEAFFAGNEFFGIEKPKLFATIPVVKYAELDIDNNGVIDEADKALADNHDINCDGEVNEDDVKVYENYFADTAQHLDDVYTITVKNNDNSSGKLIINGAVSGTYPEYKIRKGTIVTVSAVGWTGYEFSYWTGDAEGQTSDTLVLKADCDYTIGAKYKSKPVYALNISATEGGTVLASTNGTDYGTPKAEYPEDTLLYLKAIPDEGYIAESWSGDASGVADIQKVVVTDKDLNINVSFTTGYNESYSSDNWECITKNLPDGAYTVNSSSKRISFNYSSFNYKPILINNAVGLAGDWTVSAGIRESIPMGKSHPAMIIFGYIDEKNYQYFEYDNDGNGSAALYKVVDGEKTLTAQYSGSLESGNTEFTSCPVDIKIQCKDGKLSVKGYKNGDEITYFENLEGSFSGRFGLGASFHGYLYFNNIKATYTGDAQTHAEYDEETNYVNIYGYSVAAQNSVSLMCVNNTDNSIYYARQYTPENDGYYRFTFKVFDDISNYSVILRSGSEDVKAIELN